jgi:HEAT repeat protein
MPASSRLSELEIAAYARRAVDEVARAPDPDAAADRVLKEAPDARVRQAIVEMSVGGADRLVAAVVGAAVRGGEEEVSRTAADLLPDIGDSPTAVQVLRQCLDSPDAGIRCRAVEAVESVSDPQVVQLLPAALTDETDAVRRAATVALGVIVGTPYHRLREATLKELSVLGGPLARAVLQNPDDQVRRQVAQGLGFVKSNAVLPVLERFCNDEDAELRQEAVLSLAAIGSQQAVDLMARCLNDPSHRVASSVLDMLAARLGGSSTAFLEHLKAAMKHPAADVRRHAVLMLDRYGLDQVLPILTAALADEDFEVARQAGEMLRRTSGQVGLDWLAREMKGHGAGADGVWEAGNIGQEARAAGILTKRGEPAAGTDAVVPILEDVLAHGASSDRIHAANELLALVDIGDSPAMQKAFDDRDPAVRSRLAEALAYTRDAGLLVSLLRVHPDALVRRRAVEALARNPGGPRLPGGMGSQVTFSSTRTGGVELFGHFLAALRDEDSGVVQTACGAIRDHAQTVQVCPVRQAVGELERVAASGDVSFLLKEDAASAAAAVGRVPVSGIVAGSIREVLEWRGRLAREAHAVRYDEAAGHYVVAPGIDEAALKRWAAQYGLSEAEVADLGKARVGGGLQPQTAARIVRGLLRDMAAALGSVSHAARALRLVGQQGFEGDLEAWAAAVQTAPRLEWGTGETAQKLQRRLTRLRRHAWIEAQLARRAGSGEDSRALLPEVAKDEDDWVRMAAWAAVSEANESVPDDAQGVVQLCRLHAEDEEYGEPLGRCAAGLLRAGMGDGAALARAALASVDLDTRTDLTQLIMLAAQRQTAGAALLGFLSGKRLDDVPHLCLAVALVGAGNKLEGVLMPDGIAGGDDPEPMCAYLAVRAMGNDAEAAQKLEDLLRHGQPKERYCSAHYLALARVRSATPTLSSARDQEGPYMLKGLCGACLVRCGHLRGLAWFEQVLKSATGIVKAHLLTHLCAAVEDIVPLMIECRDVNVGRFV